MNRPLIGPLGTDEPVNLPIPLQFAAVCWRMAGARPEILLLTTRRTRRWVVPKGWPMAGRTPAEAAAIEAWEEAGVTGAHAETALGTFDYVKEKGIKMDLPCVVAVYPLKVTEVHADWPERRQRFRRWLAPRDAARLVVEPDLRAILSDFRPPA